MQYEQALQTLAALGPELRTGNTLQPGAPPRKFSLEHIRALLGSLGDPQKTFPAVLIAGTNGKGSTAATLASVCAAAGLRTGLYTSPHLLRVNERIRVSLGETAPTSTQAESRPGLLEIPDGDFGRLFGEVYARASEMVEQQLLPHLPSFFELLTAVAFLYFSEERLEIAILEVGLGGRLDATNVVEPLLSVITDIGIDHTEFLGNTLTEIALEKAGILREGGVLVTLSQHPEANAAIGERAVALNVRGVDASRCLPPRGFIGEPAGATLRSQRGPAQSSDAPTPAPPSPFNQNEVEGPTPVAHAEGMARQGTPNHGAPAGQGEASSPLGRNCYPLSIDGEILRIDSPLSGHHQQRNVALAVAAALELRANHGFVIPNIAIEAGVRATVWPGRLEWIPPAPPPARQHAPFLLDVAHNPAGAWALRAALAQLPEDRPRTLLFGCLADKQIGEIARILLPLFDSTAGDPARRRDHIVLAPLQNPRAATAEQLLAAVHALDVPAHVAPHLPGALGQAEALTPVDGIIVATGSVYLIGEVRALLAQEATRHLHIR